ncbi:MAG: flagellar hook-associated protein FlgK [Bdellovibrionia bacterium]
MGIANIVNTGYSGLVASKSGISTTGHNIANANTEGYSRQKIVVETRNPRAGEGGRYAIGNGVNVVRVDRINDSYLEKHLRNAQREIAYHEEKGMGLAQVEDIFNELGGDGINRLMSRFFNEFRKLANEPENTALRESVREASQAMVNDFRSVRDRVKEVSKHIDSRIEGYTEEFNRACKDVADLNQEIKAMESVVGHANDLMDRRDQALKKLGSFCDISTFQDQNGVVQVDVKNVGPVVHGMTVRQLIAERGSVVSSDEKQGLMQIRAEGSALNQITHQLKGGRLGALIELRDLIGSRVLDRLDALAYGITQAINGVHSQGVNAQGETGVNYFKRLETQERAAEFFDLSDEVKGDSRRIATALEANAPGDNRIAVAISSLQYEKIIGEGQSTADDWFNSIVSDVGVASSRVRSAMNHQKDVVTQLSKIRDQISGVSIDEESANLIQFQHTFDASAKVIQVADEMLKTILQLKRD